MRLKKSKRDTVINNGDYGNNSKHAKRTRHLKLIIVSLTGLVAVLVIGLYLSQARTKNTNGDSDQAFQEVLQVEPQGNNDVTVNSTLGFSTTYNKKLFEGQGWIIAENDKLDYVTGEDLWNNKDKYSPLFLSYIEPETPTANVLSDDFDIRNTNMYVSSSTVKDFFVKRKKEFGASLSDTELATKFFAPKSSDKITYKATSPTKVKIGETEYTKIVYKASKQYSYKESEPVGSPDGGQVNYITIQNGRPYVMKLTYYEFTSSQTLALFEQIIAQTKYTKPDANSGVLGAKTSASDMLLPTSIFSIFGATTVNEDSINKDINVPDDLVGKTALEVVAKNQPSVVRVGSIDCKDFNLLLSGGKVGLKVVDACSVAVGTGTIISEDGYVSTNGHVVKHGFVPALQQYLAINVEAKNYKPFQTYLQYLLDSKLITESGLNTLIQGIKAGDEDAIYTILDLAYEIPQSNVKVTKEKTELAIQLSDEPIKLKDLKTASDFVYSDKVVSAKLIDFDFDQYSPDNGETDINKSKTSDVALLKIEGSSFPVASLGSINSVKTGDLATSIGFPGFVDGGLETKKARTIPSATQGVVQEIVKESAKSNRLLGITTIPTAQGNSGGPVFDTNSQVVGITTYASSKGDPEEGVSKFAGTGVMRDVADLSALVTKNKITLDTQSSIDDIWDSAITEFSNANYQKSKDLFNQVAEQYPANYLASSFIKVADTKIANGEDKSSSSPIKVITSEKLFSASNPVTLALTLLILITIIMIIITLILLIVHKKRGKQLQQPNPLNSPVDGSTADNVFQGNPQTQLNRPINQTATNSMPPLGQSMVAQSFRQGISNSYINANSNTNSSVINPAPPPPLPRVAPPAPSQKPVSPTVVSTPIQKPELSVVAPDNSQSNQVGQPISDVKPVAIQQSPEQSPTIEVRFDHDQ